MKAIHKPLLAGILFGASCALSNAAVLFTSPGQLVNEGNTSLSTGLSRDNSATGTLYFKYTVAFPASNNTTENYFAGYQLYEGGAERLGIGNGWNQYAYSAFATGTGDYDLNSSNPEPFVNYQEVRSTDTITIVFRVDYVSGGNDAITVWLNPDLGLNEASQSASLTTSFFANATFNDIRLREGGGGGGWNFSNIAIAENSTDSGFFAVPEPSAALLGAVGLISLLRRKR